MASEGFVQDSVSPWLSHPGEPFNPVELQRQFTGMSARDVYVLLCKRNGCHSISSVVNMLPEKPGEWGVEVLDISGTYVGPKGIVPVAELCKLLANLKELCLAENYLTNDSLWSVCKMALHHPTLQKVDFSSNSISWTAGMSILELVTRNSQIHRVFLNDTNLKPKVIAAINEQVKKNLTISNRQARRGPNPCNHPLTIRLRGLKKVFGDLHEKDGDSGLISKRYLLDGVQHVLKLSGRDVNEADLIADSLISRHEDEFINWEAFMLLLLLEEVTYSRDAVETLRTVFSSFDSNSIGYIEAGEMSDILRMIYGKKSVTSEEVDAKLQFFDLDPSMTLTWDEFLLLFYERGPVVGELATLSTNTPLQRNRSIHR